MGNPAHGILIFCPSVHGSTKCLNHVTKFLFSSNSFPKLDRGRIIHCEIVADNDIFFDLYNGRFPSSYFSLPPPSPPSKKNSFVFKISQLLDLFCRKTREVGSLWYRPLVDQSEGSIFVTDLGLRLPEKIKLLTIQILTRLMWERAGHRMDYQNGQKSWKK